MKKEETKYRTERRKKNKTVFPITDLTFLFGLITRHRLRSGQCTQSAAPQIHCSAAHVLGLVLFYQSSLGKIYLTARPASDVRGVVVAGECMGTKPSFVTS